MLLCRAQNPMSTMLYSPWPVMAAALLAAGRRRSRQPLGGDALSDNLVTVAAFRRSSAIGVSGACRTAQKPADPTSVTLPILRRPNNHGSGSTPSFIVFIVSMLTLMGIGSEHGAGARAHRRGDGLTLDFWDIAGAEPRRRRRQFPLFAVPFFIGAGELMNSAASAGASSTWRCGQPHSRRPRLRHHCCGDPDGQHERLGAGRYGRAGDDPVADDAQSGLSGTRPVSRAGGIIAPIIPPSMPSSSTA